MFRHYELAMLASNSYTSPADGVIDGDLQFCITKKNGETVIAVAGTNAADPRDVIRDLSAWPVCYPGMGFVHDGFAKAGMEMWKQVASHVRGCGPNERVSYVGHSLGGAIAIIMSAAHELQTHQNQINLVTFGAPKVAFLSPTFDKLMNRHMTYEYCRDGDPVPDLPFFPYAHPTRPLVIGEAVLDPISNHDIAKYIQDLKDLGV